ncbi:hypothetical protein BASA60_000163 [Batrachochytrium salamandrivorans]|nr:hypothetical protein BASA60_000163 [Batrachochytrium salamandrivorans]
MRLSTYVLSLLNVIGLVIYTRADITHQISITMAVDNVYKLTIDGYDIDELAPPITSNSWQNVVTYNKNVSGEGPWLIGIKESNYGDVSGLFAVVSFDGVPYSATGKPNNKFRMTPTTPADGWETDLDFADSSWFTQTYNSCNDYDSRWSTLFQNFRNVTDGEIAYAMWYPNCQNTGSDILPKDMYFRFVVDYAKPMLPITELNPVAAHVLSITMAVDSYYDLMLDGLYASVVRGLNGTPNITTWSKIVYGEGPWLISVQGYNTGSFAGLFAVASLNGIPYSTTATPNSLFRMTPDTPAVGWNTSVHFPDNDWYTQTFDSCVPFNVNWNSLFRNLDVRTGIQIARSMWYPSCINTGTKDSPTTMYFRLLVSPPKSPPIYSVVNPVPAHLVEVTMAVADAYDLFIDGQAGFVPLGTNSWQNVITYTKIVFGDGPWLLSVHSYGIGDAAGLFAVVTLDGMPYSTTGTPNNKFRMYPDTPEAGWRTSLSFPDQEWFTQIDDTCSDYNDKWSVILDPLNARTGGQMAHAMWYPDCHNTGTIASPKDMYFRLKINGPNSVVKPAQMNPVVNHLLAITIAMDDYYDLTVDGLSTSVSFNSTGEISVTTWTKTVLGQGPWLVSIRGYDVGDFAGLFAMVSLDGVPFSTTATPNSLFRMTPTSPKSGWDSDPYFPDGDWYTQTHDTCSMYADYWSALLPALDAHTGSETARSMWYPNCTNVGSPHAPKSMYFRLRVDQPITTVVNTAPSPTTTLHSAVAKPTQNQTPTGFSPSGVPADTIHSRFRVVNDVSPGLKIMHY